MSIKVLAIINPTSGKGNISDKVEQIRNNIEEQGMEIDIKFTKKDYNAKKIIESYEKEKDLILICGGDGTLNEAMTAIMDKNLNDVSVSFIPYGTTNDLARTLDIPRKNVDVTKNLLQSKAKRIDIGKFGENKYFCYVAAFGIMTDISYTTSQKAKHKYGRLAYYINAIKQLSNIPTYRMKVKYDNKKIEDEFIYGGITNSESIAGLRWFAKNEIQLDDGAFEGIFIRKPRSINGYMKILGSFFRKDYNDNEYILFTQANNFEIEAQEEINWTIDGEFAGDFKKIGIQNCKKAIELVLLK